MTIDWQNKTLQVQVSTIAKRNSLKGDVLSNERGTPLNRRQKTNDASKQKNKKKQKTKTKKINIRIKIKTNYLTQSLEVTIQV